MKPPRRPAAPEKWLHFARRYLQVAQHAYQEGLAVEPLCFAAQQSVEMALKSLLVAANRAVPFTHEISTLIDHVEDAGFAFPPGLASIRRMTMFAVATRYPSDGPALDVEIYESAVRDAESVLDWVSLEYIRYMNSEHLNDPH